MGNGNLSHTLDIVAGVKLLLTWETMEDMPNADLIPLLRERVLRALNDEDGQGGAVGNGSAPHHGKAATPSYEDVFGTDSEPTPMHEDFVVALRAAGYDAGPAVMARWGLTDLSSMSPEMRRAKLEAIKQSAGMLRPPTPAGVDVTSCPNIEKHGEGFEGWENRQADGKVWYKCKDKECMRPGGQPTTWDERNWETRRAEFRTNQPHVPQRRGSWGNVGSRPR